MIPYSRAHLIEQGKRLWGDAFPDHTTAADLPLSGARRLTVTFLAGSAVWRFNSDLYSRGQEKRVRQFLLGSTVSVCDHLVSRGTEEWSGLNAATYKALLPGAPAERLLHNADAIPYVALPLGTKGFCLSYSREDDNVHLHFGQDQALVAKVPEAKR